MTTRAPHNLVIEALLRPGVFATWLLSAHGAQAITVSALARLLLLTYGIIVAVALLRPAAWPLISPSIAIGALLTLAFGALAAALAGLAGLIRSVVAILPPATLLVFVLLLGPCPPDLLVIATFTLAGLWAAGVAATGMHFRHKTSESSLARWVLAVGTSLAGALLLCAPPLCETLSPYGLICIGFGVGQIRPLGLLWEAPLSLGLALLAKLGVAPARLLRAHPARYDELVLAPLPGLASLLAAAVEADHEAGGHWLVQLAGHPTQGAAARRALERVIRRGRSAHSLLFWLSTDRDGAAWLRALGEAARTAHPLILAYGAFSAAPAPAWPQVAARQRQALAHSAHLPGGQVALALITCGGAVLAAERWAQVGQALEHHPLVTGVALDRHWAILARLQRWARAHDAAQRAAPGDWARAHDAAQRAAPGDAVAPLGEPLEATDGWPRRLVAAMAEHMGFLLSIERSRAESERDAAS